MLAVFRRYLNTWPARLFFMLLVGSFSLWGVADVVRNIANDTAAVTVGGQKVEMPELQDAYRREVAQAQRSMGGAELTPDQRRMLAMQAAERLITQIALQQDAGSLGIAVPDDALRQAVFDVPQFRGQNGQFDRALMDNVLRNTGLSEKRFLDMMRDDLRQRQVMGAVRAGTAAPATLANQVFAIQQEKRVAEVVDVPLMSDAVPPKATDAQLERWWANHPERYSTPELRRVKAIILSPETLASEIQITDDELKAAFEQHKSEFNKPERRSVQVLLAQDEAVAQALSTQWSIGATWDEMQAAGNKAGAAPVELTEATRAEFPAPELGEAVFATPEGVVAPPVHSALGWHVLKVTKVSGGVAQNLEEVRDLVRARVLAEKAADLIYDRANRIENLLSSGTTLDNLPSDLGVAAVTGTMDDKGNAASGEPAPIPGPAELRPALIKAAFATKPGDLAKLEQAPNAPNGSQSFFALVVEEITPPAPRPFADVSAQVGAEWAGDQIRHGREEIAARILASVKSGRTLASAAEKEGLKPRTLPATGHGSPAEGVPPNLLDPLFSLKQVGDPTMIETQDGFVVAVLSAIQQPDPKADPIGFSQVKEALARSMSEDMQQVYAAAVRAEARPRVNQALVESLAVGGAGGE